MRNRGTTGEQWDRCGRCGFEYPMSKLTVQDGLKVCTLHCYDNPVPKQRDAIIQRILSQTTTEQEGQDTRDLDLAFFAGRSDEEVV